MSKRTKSNHSGIPHNALRIEFWVWKDFLFQIPWQRGVQSGPISTQNRVQRFGNEPSVIWNHYSMCWERCLKNFPPPTGNPRWVPWLAEKPPWTGNASAVCVHRLGSKLEGPKVEIKIWVDARFRNRLVRSCLPANKKKKRSYGLLLEFLFLLLFYCSTSSQKKLRDVRVGSCCCPNVPTVGRRARAVLHCPGWGFGSQENCSWLSKAE